MLQRQEIQPTQRVSLWERSGESWRHDWLIDRSYPGAHIRNDDAWWAWLEGEQAKGKEIGFFPEGDDPNERNLCRFVGNDGRVQTGCEYCAEWLARDDDW